MSAKTGTLEYWQEVAEAVTDDARTLRAELAALRAELSRSTELLESCRGQNASLIEQNKRLRAALKKAVPALEDMGDAFARMAHPTLSSIVSEQLIGLRAALGGR